MPKSKQRVRKDTGEVLPSSKKHDRIRELLKIQLLTFPQKELFEEELGNWERDLDPFPLPAIEWAFDNWRRNGRWFPVYGDILDQCIAYEPPEKYAYSPGCDAECRQRHHKGYNETDMKILNQFVVSLVLAEGRPKDQRLSEDEIESILSQLDQKRGSAPEWRL